MVVEDALKDALEEIRNISGGLVLPELDGLTLTEVLAKATKTHEMRTGTKVEQHFGDLPISANRSACICFYRFIQEGLINAYNHVPNASCSVTARRTADSIEVKVIDRGDGFDQDLLEKSSHISRLGLSGLRERIESLGGKFEILSTIDEGTELAAIFLEADLEVEDGK